LSITFKTQTPIYIGLETFPSLKGTVHKKDTFSYKKALIF